MGGIIKGMKQNEREQATGKKTIITRNYNKLGKTGSIRGNVYMDQSVDRAEIKTRTF